MKNILTYIRKWFDRISGSGFNDPFPPEVIF
jgi:hypothetical protein